MTEPGSAANAQLTPDQYGRKSTATVVLVVVVLVLIVAGICVLTYLANIGGEEPSGTGDGPAGPTPPPEPPGGAPGPPPGPAP